MTGEEGTEPCPPAGRVGSQGDQIGLDVRVVALLIRVGVMSVVFGHPPAEAQAHEQSGDNARRPFIPCPGGEDLTVRGLVREEAELCHDHSDQAGSEELKPGSAEDDDCGEQSRQHHEPDDDSGQVEAPAASQQSCFVDDLAQLSVRFDVVFNRRHHCHLRPETTDALCLDARPSWNSCA